MINNHEKNIILKEAYAQYRLELRKNAHIFFLITVT